jgi:uncharacterized protein YndB with AHSA1/START domain
MSTDRIEKSILLGAPRERVWRAISDSRRFGLWFGVRFQAPFVAGVALTGRSTPTKVDSEVARMQKVYEGHPFEIIVERLEPMRIFSFRWHPFAVDKSVDYSSEPSTLVVFDLQEAFGGTILTITESGFDRLPLARRAVAFAANEGGWGHQVKLIDKYLAGADEAER